MTQTELADNQAAWENVFTGIINAHQKGKSIDDEEVIALGKKALELVSQFTGDEPGIKQSHQNMYSENGAEVLQKHGVEIEQEAFDLLRQAMGAAQSHL